MGDSAADGGEGWRLLLLLLCNFGLLALAGLEVGQRLFVLLPGQDVLPAPLERVDDALDRIGPDAIMDHADAGDLSQHHRAVILGAELDRCHAT